jgi:hypothetical protein
MHSIDALSFLLGFVVRRKIKEAWRKSVATSVKNDKKVQFCKSNMPWLTMFFCT